MKLIKQMTQAGSAIFCKITEKRNRSIAAEKRRKRQNPTTEQVARLNERNSIKKLNILLNHNFRDGDYFISLTYLAVPLSKEKIRKDRDNFLKRLRYLYHKRGVVLKWFCTPETVTQRANFHIVVNSDVPIEEIQNIWKYGIADYVCLNSHGDYGRLADYLVKETKVYFRTEESICKRRWSCSRTVVMPNTKEEPATTDELDNPKIPDGYYIDSDSLYQGVNPISGRPFTEYKLLSLSHESAYEGWAQLNDARPIYDGYIKWLREKGEYQLAFELEEEVYKYAQR